MHNFALAKSQEWTEHAQPEMQIDEKHVFFFLSKGSGFFKRPFISNKSVFIWHWKKMR